LRGIRVMAKAGVGIQVAKGTLPGNMEHFQGQEHRHQRLLNHSWRHWWKIWAGGVRGYGNEVWTEGKFWESMGEGTR
jgi:hypothetical protein